MSEQGTVVASGEPPAPGSPDTTTGGVWTPDCWRFDQNALIAQARAKNEAGYQGVFAAAGRGSQPPAHTVEHV